MNDIDIIQNDLLRKNSSPSDLLKSLGIYNKSTAQGFKNWLTGKQQKLPEKIRSSIENYIQICKVSLDHDTFLPSIQINQINSTQSQIEAEKLDYPEGTDIDIIELSKRLESISISSQFYVYVYFNNNLIKSKRMTITDFADGVFYVGKGKDDRMLHKNCDDPCTFVCENNLTKDNQKLYTIKIPFNSLTENQSLFIENQLILALLDYNKHLWMSTSHQCNDPKLWNKKCLSNRIRGSRRQELEEGDPYKNYNKVDLLNIAFKYFEDNVFRHCLA